VFAGILKSQGGRLRKLSSRKEDFEEAIEVIMKSLVKRGYSRAFLWKHLHQMPKTITPMTDCLPLVVDYDARTSKEIGVFKWNWDEQIRRNDYDNVPEKITLAYKCQKNLLRLLVNKDSCE
jgi:hypothetical protein